MKKQVENLCYLLAYSWKKCKLLYFVSVGKAVFLALVPLIDIAGLGLVVDALVNSQPRREKSVEIVFDNVTFAYPGSSNNVLEHLNLTIRQGEKLMIVGANGSGKTTLIKLLCKQYRPSSGYITLNGRDIWSIPNEVYYRTVAAVFQDYRNFAFTLVENVSLTEKPDNERILKILYEVGLGIFLENLPGGINTSLTRQFATDGVELSGGQDQKLAIARAIYKDAPLLILDEPTASLDAKAESEIYADFGRMAAGKTTIFISHRLAASMLAERIVVLVGGRITECGTHAQLLQKGGSYSKMFTA